MTSRSHSVRHDADMLRHALMWRTLARQCREHGDLNLAAEAEALARQYERRSVIEKGSSPDRAA